MTMTIKEGAFWPDPQHPQYGLLFCVDEAGNRWTLRGDPQLVKMAMTLNGKVDVESTTGTGIGGSWEQRPGWPDEWTNF